MPAKISYQKMAAHFAAMASNDAPQQDNIYRSLQDFSTKLKRKQLFLDFRNEPVRQGAENLSTAMDELLKASKALAETAAKGDEAATKKQLELSAAACENFSKYLAAFKKNCLGDPAFLTSARDVKLFETCSYSKGENILRAAGLSDQDLADEDIEEIKNNLPEEDKERLSHAERKQEKLEKQKTETQKKYGASLLESNPLGDYLDQALREETHKVHEAAEAYAMEHQRPIKAEGWTRKEDNDARRPYDPMFLEQPGQERSWKNYRLIHLRNADPDQEDFKEHLAKAIVATFRMSRPKDKQKPFSVEKARADAKEVMNLPSFKIFCENRKLVRKYLNGDKLFQACGGLFRPFHLVEKDKSIEILQALKKLPDKMDDPDGQPKEWKALISSLKSIDPYADDENRERQMQAVYDATAAYMKGRKSVRSTQEEKNQFNQAMDVLGTLAKGGDFAKCAANVIVNRTNEVRERLFHKHEYIHIEDFGEDKIDQHVNEAARSNSLGDIDLEIHL